MMIDSKFNLIIIHTITFLIFLYLLLNVGSFYNNCLELTIIRFKP